MLILTECFLFHILKIISKKYSFDVRFLFNPLTARFLMKFSVFGTAEIRLGWTLRIYRFYIQGSVDNLDPSALFAFCFSSRRHRKTKSEESAGIEVEVSIESLKKSL